MRESFLVNTLGHASGVLVFGIFLFLLLRERSGALERSAGKPALAAALALAWNLVSLLVLSEGSTAGPRTQALATTGFSVLSLLPAVLFDLSVAERWRKLVAAGYALSAAAIVLHVCEWILNREGLHRWGLNSITLGFGAISAVAAAAALLGGERDRRAAASRTIATMALFLLAVSFVHFDAEHAEQLWSRELFFHHAGIPLALIVLLQDYRFVLLDAFLRFLTNVAVAGGFLLLGIVAWSRIHWEHRTPFEQALLIIASVLLLILHALVRGRAQRLLTRIAFRRPERDRWVSALRDLALSSTGEREYLDRASALVAEFLEAEWIQAEAGECQAMDLRSPVLASDLGRVDALSRAGVQVVVPLWLGPGEQRFLLLGRRRGGRRYLSEDLEALARAAQEITGHVERFRESEMRRLVAQAELKALQSQINPHFLFNALNTLYGVIPREARGARETVLNLADIFRYFLNIDKTYLPLGKELKIIRAYLDIEHLRLGDRLESEMVAPANLLDTPIPVLSIQPLVENAIKHGVARKPGGGKVRLEVAREGGVMRVLVSDTGGGFDPASETHGSGVGLSNVEQRLKLCYGPEFGLTIRSSETGSEVSFAVPVPELAETT
ncbi:MAG: histidine kinase [Bryobacteraceae bacterium]|nr:histidine kinase [Bryobacteraceae bacterium]